MNNHKLVELFRIDGNDKMRKHKSEQKLAMDITRYDKNNLPLN